MTLMTQYFYQGKMISCYEEAKRHVEDASLKEQAEMYIKLVERFNLLQIPTPVLTSEASQQVERPDENYEVMDEVLAMRKIDNEEQFQLQVKMLEEVAKTGSNEEKAHSFFTQGQLFLFAHHYEESAYCFAQAVKHNPTLGVYFGIAAQTMMRLDYPPFEVLTYLEYASILDPLNSRWHWNRALVLTQLYKDLKEEMFLENALVSLEEAQNHLRADQKSLAQAIENTFENMKEHLFN